MWPGAVLVGFALVLGPEPNSTSAADAVTLRDGTVVLGQVIEPSPRGPLLFLVRRVWAEANAPSWARRWQEADAPRVKRARSQRRERLSAWQRERRPEAGPEDPIGTWIAAELARLGGDTDSPAPLMIVSLPRAEVKAVSRRPLELGRRLRQGWLAGFAEVEAMAPEDLTSALEGRGFAVRGTELPLVDELLPIPLETDAQWQVRRAATEVSHERTLWFIRNEGLVLPETEPGAPAAATAALSSLTALLQDEPGDPLQPRLRAAEAQGRSGLVVTRLEAGPDGSSVKVEMTLWARSGASRWASVGSRQAVVRADEVRPGAADQMAADPQIRAAFGIIESLGLGDVGEEARRRALKAGAATQMALGRARTDFALALEALVLPVDAAPRPAPGR